MPGLLSAYFGRRAAGRATLCLSGPAVARPADLAGFLVSFLAAPFADFFMTFLAAFAASGLAARVPGFTGLRAAVFLGTRRDALAAAVLTDALAVTDALGFPSVLLSRFAIAGP